MEAKELRIGNWVYNVDVPIQVSYIQHFFEGEEPDLHPIPLTREILEKAGFEFDGEIYSKNCLFISKYMNFLIHEPNGGYFDSKPIHYLHQLQNLYFALTGQELDIQL